MPAPVNKFGRKGGRGVRPFLIIPKILGVAIYFGGIVAAVALVFSDWPRSAEEFRSLGSVLRRIFLFAAVPGLLVAILFGILLLLQNRRVFIKMRWLQVKLALLVITLPAFHLWISSLVHTLRHAPSVDADVNATFAMLRAALLAAMVAAAIIITLGRHKPRLGTNRAVNHEDTKITKKSEM